MQRKDQLLQLLTSTFSPSHIELVNESHMHSVPPNSETHFKLVMVSDRFESLSKVKRHQAVYQSVGAMMQEGLHALALHLYTPEEWAQNKDSVPSSPNCMGGSKSEQA